MRPSLTSSDLTVVKADVGTRTEVIVTSFCDDGLEGSEQEASRFIEEIVRVTGRNSSAQGLRHDVRPSARLDGGLPTWARGVRGLAPQRGSVFSALDIGPRLRLGVRHGGIVGAPLVFRARQLPRARTGPMSPDPLRSDEPPCVRSQYAGDCGVKVQDLTDTSLSGPT
jgi:hypothetical protein